MEHDKQKTILIPSEIQECVAYWEWSQNIPVLKDYLYKIPNEGKRSLSYGKKMKMIGLRSGLPDYHYPIPNETFNGFWLEMKTRDKKNHSLPDLQKIWLNKLNKANHYATFAFGWEDAAEKTISYIKNLL